MLLAAGPTAVWLVELVSGDAIDLTALNERGEHLIDSATISPDGDWLITFQTAAGLLISLTESTDPISIDADPLVPYPSFDDSGKVIYAVSNDGSTTIRSLDPQTGARTDIATTPGSVGLARTNGRPLLLVDERGLSVLTPDVAIPKPIFTWTNEPSTVFVSADGSRLLVSDEDDGGPRWYLVDVDSGVSQELPDLTQVAPLAVSARAESLLFTPIPPAGPGDPGAPYLTIDLMTGQLQSPLHQDSDDVYRAEAAGDANGRYTIVNAVSPGNGRVWLIDSLLGTATQVATSSGNAAARVSPDGCQLAVAVYDTVGEGRTSQVTVMSLIDGSTTITIPDALLLGWAAVDVRE